MFNIARSTINYPLTQIGESRKVQLSTKIKEILNMSDNCADVVTILYWYISRTTLAIHQCGSEVVPVLTGTTNGAWKHFSTLYSPACLFPCAVPVSKFAGRTATAYTDTTSTASGKE